MLLAGHRRAAPAEPAIPERRCRAACSRSSARRRASASPTCACSPARCSHANASASAAGRRQRRPRSGSSRRPAPRDVMPSGRRDGDGPRARRGPGRRRDRRTAGRRGRRRAVPAAHARSVVFARAPEQQGSLRAALTQLAEQDPLIDVRQDDHRHEISVSLYGEVQKEVIQATLERDYGVGADFRETTTVCIERPARVGEAEEVIQREDARRTSPAGARRSARTRSWPRWPCGSSRRRSGPGSSSGCEVEPRLVPLYLFRTPDAFTTQMEAFVREALAEGLAGWQVTDCRVTMTDCGYASPATSAADFRRLTQLVLMTALERAGTWVCEPLADLALEMPAVDGAGRPRRARETRRPRARPVLGERPVEGPGGAAGRARPLACSTSCPACRWGRDPRVAPRRLPADRRQPAEATPLGPQPARPRRVARVTREARITAAGGPAAVAWRSGQRDPLPETVAPLARRAASIRRSRCPSQTSRQSRCPDSNGRGPGRRPARTPIRPRSRRGPRRSKVAVSRPSTDSNERPCRRQPPSGRPG